MRNIETTTTVTWVTAAVACVVVAVLGFTLLWFLARRALGDDQVSPARRSFSRFLEARVERLILWRPDWSKLLPKIGAPLLVAVSIGLGAAAIWALATATPTVESLPEPVSNGGLPWDSALDRLVDGTRRMMFPVTVLAGGVAIAMLLIGANTRAAVSLMMCAAVVFAGFRVTRMFSSGSMNAVSSYSSHSANTSTGVRPPTAAGLKPEGVQREAGEGAASAALAEAQDDAEMLSTDASEAPPLRTVRRAPAHTHDSFGVQDALMLYGTYKLLTYDHAGTEHAAVPVDPGTHLTGAQQMHKTAAPAHQVASSAALPAGQSTKSAQRARGVLRRTFRTATKSRR